MLYEIGPRLQGLILTVDHRPESSDFIVRPVNLNPSQSGGLVFPEFESDQHLLILLSVYKLLKLVNMKQTRSLLFVQIKIVYMEIL